MSQKMIIIVPKELREAVEVGAKEFEGNKSMLIRNALREYLGARGLYEEKG